MKFDNIQEGIAWLDARNREYRDGKPTVTDSEYDQIESMIQKIAPTHPFFQNLKDDVASSKEGFLSEKPLTIHMGSQNKALNIDEMKSYLAATAGKTLNASLKLDGMSAEITYSEGSLVSIISRGDGVTGVDYMANVIHARNLPRYIDMPGTVCVRVEILLKKSDLEALNQLLIEDGEEPYQNTRNGCVALVKTEGRRKYCHLLTVQAFDMEVM